MGSLVIKLDKYLCAAEQKYSWVVLYFYTHDESRGLDVILTGGASIINPCRLLFYFSLEIVA